MKKYGAKKAKQPKGPDTVSCGYDRNKHLGCVKKTPTTQKGRKKGY